jgi:hypothetical protein
MPYAPTVEVSLDENPAPRVEVIFESLDPDTESLRAIHRLGDDRDYRVRRSVNIPVTDSTARLDVEVPFGIPVTYRAEMLDGAGESLGYTDPSDPVTLAVEDTWVHNPLDPTTSLKVQFRANAARELSRPVRGSTEFPSGRRVGVVVGGERQGLRGVVLDIIVDTIEAADRFAALVGDYNTTTVPVLCFRIGASDRIRLPRPLFASVFNPVERDVDYIHGGTRIAFDIEADEVSPPTPAVVVPLLTNADLNAYYASNTALNADNLTNLGVNRRYDLAGTA